MRMKYEKKYKTEYPYPIANILFVVPDLSLSNSYFDRYDFLKMYNITFVTPEWASGKGLKKSKSKKRNIYEKVYFHPDTKGIAQKLAVALGIRDVIEAVI